jgi:outer membrane protein insertion porin family
LYLSPESSRSRANPRLSPFALLIIGLLLHYSGILNASTSSGQDLRAAADAYGKVIRSIDYQSEEPVERAHLDPLLGLKPGDTLSRTTLKQAIQALFDTGRFSQIVVDARPQDTGIQLLFNLRLNLYFNHFIVEGDTGLRRRAPSEAMSLPVGQRFTPQRLQATRQTVLDYLHDRGYLRAQVDARTDVDKMNRQVDVTLTVRMGPQAKIRSVEVSGVPPAEEKAVMDRFSLKAGQLYRRERINQCIEKVKAYLLKRGYLAAEPKLSESFDTADDTVGLVLEISRFGKVRVEVEGFKVPRDRLSRLLPVLSGAGAEPELLDEGARNLHEYLEEQGYPEAEIEIKDERDGSGAGVVRYQIDPGDKVTVSEIRFKGNRVFSDERLLSIMQIRPARFLQKSSYSISKLDSDVRALEALYRSEGYLDATVIPLVESAEGGSKLRITFEFDEGSLSLTRSVSFKDNQALTAASLEAKLSLHPGGPYSPQLAERSRVAVLNAYNNEGFLQARVFYHAAGPDEHKSYAVEFDIEEGLRSFVDRILILGNERTRLRVIEKRVKLQENEPLSTGKMLETERELYDLGVFNLVRVSPQNPESSAGYQNVVVRVREGDQYVLHYGFGYQQRDKVRGLLEISNINFLGGARRADLRFRASAVQQSAVLSFQQAKISLLPVNSYLSFSYAHEKEISFDTLRLSASYQYSHPLSGHSWAIGRINFQNVQVSDLKIPEDQLGHEDTPRNLTTISAIYINDSRDNYFDPEKGFSTSTSIGVTPRWLGSNNYISLYTQNSYNRRLAATLNLSVGLRFGYLRPYGRDTEVPISERFFAGGPSSLRGFKTDEAGPLDPQTNKPVGGNALIITNLELRAPLYRMLQIEGFYDGGNVFKDLKSIRGSDFSHSVGIGLRIRTPIGPLRFEYAFNLNLPDALQLPPLNYPRRLFFFTVGAPF